MGEIIEIHPYDFYDLLGRIGWEDFKGDVTILKNSGYINRPDTDLVRVDGQLYRQTVHAPITSEAGKKMAEDAKRKRGKMEIL